MNAEVAYNLGQKVKELLEVIEEALHLQNLSTEEYNKFWDNYCRGANGEKMDAD